MRGYVRILPLVLFPALALVAPAAGNHAATARQDSRRLAFEVCQAGRESARERELEEPDARQRDLEIGDDEPGQDELERGSARQRELESPDRRQQELDTPDADDDD